MDLDVEWLPSKTSGSDNPVVEVVPEHSMGSRSPGNCPA